MIKLIIFDMGGVVIDFDERYAYDYLSNNIGVSTKRVGEVFDPIIKQMEYGRITLNSAIKIASKKLGRKITIDEWKLSFMNTAHLNQKTLRTIIKLSKNYKVVALTNVTKSRYIMFFKHFIEEDIFAKVFASCYLGMRKPEHKIYRYVIKYMNIKAQQTLFIDNLKVNVIGAKQIGMNGIVFNNNTQLDKSLKRIGVL